MNFQDAVRQSIRQYFDGKEPSDYRKAVGGRTNKKTRNKSYFDGIEKDLGLKVDEAEEEDNMKEEMNERDA